MPQARSASSSRGRGFASRARSAVLLAAVAVFLGSAALPAGEAVHHLLLARFADTATKAEIKSILDDFESLPAKIPGFKAFQWGLNNSPEGFAKGFTHAFLMTFENKAARDAYIAHPEHGRFAARFKPLTADLFVFDLAGVEGGAPAEPGRVHHLVFFKYKSEVPEAKVAEITAAFGALPKKISGCLGFQAGLNDLPNELQKGLTHGHVLTFINERARNDYLIHPAHKEFGGLVGPAIADLLVVDFTVAPSSRSLFITSGLEPYAVYQRGGDNTADLEFTGLSREDGDIEARLLLGRRTVPGFDWRSVGRCEGGIFKAVLPKVPAGGEYTVEVRRRDSLGAVADVTEVANILVGDIWILAGQSNMEGVGDLIDVEPPLAQVHCYTMAHRWELAVEPLHWLVDSPDPVHSDPWLANQDEDGRRKIRSEARGNRRKGAGLGLPFAAELYDRTGVPIGLIASAHGGTSMAQWDPALAELGGGSLYGSLLKQAKNAGGKVKGVLWYQGESDSDPAAVPLFLDRFKALVAAFRKDFANPQLPFYYVQIGRFVREGSAVHWNAIQELQRKAESEIPNTAMVSVIDLALDDLIHVGTAGLQRTGERLAMIAHKELFGEPELAVGPRLESVKVAGQVIRVKFSDVNGRLGPWEKVEGFSVRRKDGTELKTIYQASVDPDAPDTVILKLQSPIPEGVFLHYGAGFDPVCNLVDSEDMAAPVFGPVELTQGERA